MRRCDRKPRLSSREGVSLKEFCLDKFAAAEKAVSSAHASMDHRLLGMNEFRDQLKDQAATFITRTELNARIAALEAEVRSLVKAKDQMEGKASVTSFYVVTAISLLSIAVSIAHFFVR